LRFSAALLVLVAISTPTLSEAQRARTRKKPFTAFSESAQRLKDSLAARVERLATPSAAPLVAISSYDETQLRDSIVSVARSQLGAKYRLGAMAPGKAFDCSGLIRYVLSMFRLDLPRTAREQAKMGDAIALDTASLRPGDLVAFGSRAQVSHIGIYAGNGKIIHASTSKRRVIESSFSSGNWFDRRWVSARRLLALRDTTPPPPQP